MRSAARFKKDREFVEIVRGKSLCEVEKRGRDYPPFFARHGAAVFAA